MKTADLFIECLVAHGVDHIFAVPGEENLDLLESIRKSETITLVVTRNEQSAVFMAATYGRLSGKVGVALATLGPGATNMMTGVAYAQLGGMPVLVITGQKPIKRSKQGRFQVIDVVAMMKPVTKFTTTIVDAARVPSTIAHALRKAKTERPGAVHIELPEDIAGESAEGFEPIILEKIRRPIPDPKAIASIIAKLEKAKTPLLLIGAWANRKRITKYVTKFIEKYNIPFFTSQMGKGVIDERLPQYIGTAALTSGDHLHHAISEADLIIAVWHDTVEKPTNLIEKGKTDVIHINFTVGELDETYKPSLHILGDIGNTFRQLYEASINTSWRDFETLYEKARKAHEELHRYAALHHASETMMPGRLVYEIRDVLHEEDIVTLDNGLFKLRFARNYPTYHPNTLLLDNALATMGAGYSSAIVAKMLIPDRNVVAVVGDWGLVMNLGDLATAVRMRIDLTIIVLNDNAYGMIKRKQKHHNYESFGLDLTNPDFVTLAESFGAKGYRITHPNEFKDTLTHCLAEPWVSIIEVPFHYPDEIE